MDTNTKGKCLNCGYKLDAATGIGTSERPKAGSISICFYCGAIAKFKEDLTLEGFTIEEIEELKKDVEVIETIKKFVGAIKFIQSIRN